MSKIESKNSKEIAIVIKKIDEQANKVCKNKSFLAPLASIYSYRRDHYGYNVSYKLFPCEGGYNKDLADHVRDAAQMSAISLEPFLSDSEISLLMDNYTEAINLSADFFRNSRQYGTWPVSDELREFCMNLAGFRKGSSVFFPFSGIGEFAHYSNDYKFTLDEKDGLLWGAACIYADANGLDCAVNLRSYGETYHKYDNAICIPPIGMDREHGPLELHIIDELFHKYTDNGKILLVTPQSICFQTTDKAQRIRKAFVNDNTDVTVVTLPAVFKPVAGINPCAILIDKNGSGKIRLINGVDFYNKDKSARANLIFNYRELLDAISRFDSDYCVEITQEQYRENHTLMPTVYLNSLKGYDLAEGEKFYKLGNLVKFHSKRIRFEDEEYPKIIGTQSLSDKYYDCVIDFESITPKQQKNAGEVKENSMLLGLTVDKVKVGRIYGLPNCPVAASANIMCFSLRNTDIIKEDYLLKMLASDYVTTQLNARVHAHHIPIANESDYRELLIPVPPMETQVQVLEAELRKKISQESEKLDNALQEFKDEMSSKKHSVAQTVSDLRNRFDELMIYLEQSGGFLSVEDMYEPSTNSTVKDLLKHMKATLNTISKKVESFTVSEDYSDVCELDIISYIKDMVRNNTNPMFSIRISEETEIFCDVVEDHRTVLEDKDICTVHFSKKALDQIIDNIISNAREYAFSGGSNNIIELSLVFYHQKLALEISNNGAPLHPSMTVENVLSFHGTTQPGKNGHHGRGGYEVKKLMERFKGEAHVISEPEAEFPVTYRLVFNNCYFGELILFPND